LTALPDLLAAQDGPRHFDGIVGHNILVDVEDKATAVTLIATRLASNGTISLAERIPRHTQRLYKLLELTEANNDLGDELAARLIKAEEAIYTRSDDPLVSWDVDDLAALWEATGLHVELTSETEVTEVRVSAGLLARWFGDTSAVPRPGGTRGAGQDGRPSYAQHLSALLNPTEIEQVRALFQRQLLNQTVAWHSRTVYVVARTR
jgi:putative ATPase